MNTEDKYVELCNDIKNGKMTLEEIKDYFNGYQCYIPKKDYGQLIIDLIGEVDFEIISEIIKSRKGKYFDDYTDEYGEPMLHIIVLQTTFCSNFETNKEGMFKLLEDKDSGIKWGVRNNNLEDILHIVCFLSNNYTKDDIIRFINIIKDHEKLFPLNRDDTNRNAIEVFKFRNKLPKKEQEEIVNILENFVNDSIIEVNNYYEEMVDL